KETVDSLLDELEVTRNLLAAEQARALEQERTLASERAKMARAGIGIEGFPNSAPEDPFADFDGGDLLDLGEDKPSKPAAASKPEPTPSKRPSVATASKPSKPGTTSKSATAPRPTAQELDQALASLTDDDEDETSFADLNDELAPAPEADVPVARSQARSSSFAAAAAASPSPKDSGPKKAGVATETATSRTVKLERGPARARMTVEAVDDDEWPDE